MTTNDKVFSCGLSILTAVATSMTLSIGSFAQTNNVFVFWRAFFSDPRKLAEPVELIQKARIDPLGKEASAKPMQFPDASNVPVNMLFPSDASFF